MIKKQLDIFENIIKVFLYYDRPVLFVSNVNSHKFICVLMEITDKDETWLYSEISEESLQALYKNEIDFYSCFKNSKYGESTILIIDNNGAQNSRTLFTAQILDDQLPQKGIFVSSNKGSNNEKINGQIS